MSDIQTDYDLLQDRITELLQQHQDRNDALGPIYTRAIEQEVMTLIDKGQTSQDDIDQAVYDIERRLGTVTDNVAYQVLNRAQDLIKVQQYFWDRYGYTLNLKNEFERLQAIQANSFDAFAGIPKDTGEEIRLLLRDNEIMGKSRAFVNDEIRRIADVTASRANLISGTSEMLYIGQFNANKAADIGVKTFQYKPGFVIPTSRPFSRWAVDKGTFTSEELQAIDRHKWEQVPGIPLDKTGRGWQGMIPNVPILVQGGGYNSIHRFALLFDKVSVKRKVTQPLPPERRNVEKVSYDRESTATSDPEKAARVTRRTVTDEMRTERITSSEDKIRDRQREALIVFDGDGNELAKIYGGKSSVSIPPDVLGLLPGATLTHNHPRGTSFSPEDIMLAKWFEVGEMRIAASRHDYSASITDAGKMMTMQDFEGLAYDTASRVNVVLQQRYAAGLMTSDEVDHLHWHTVWEEFRKMGLINYTKTAR